MSACCACGAYPVGDRGLAYADRLSDPRRRQPDGVRLDRELDTSFCRLAEQCLGPTQLVEELLCTSLVSDSLPRLARSPWRGGCGHRPSPICVRSVGTALARLLGTWKDPTRISLGSDVTLWVPVGTTRDLAVACRGVDDDPCKSCLQTIVAPESSRPPAPASRQAAAIILSRLRGETTNWEA